MRRRLQQILIGRVCRRGARWLLSLRLTRLLDRLSGTRLRLLHRLRLRPLLLLLNLLLSQTLAL